MCVKMLHFSHRICAKSAECLGRACSKAMFLNNLVIEPLRGRSRALKTELGTPMSKATPKVLVADDDEDSRRLLCEVLEANGYEVGAVGDGLAARETLSRDGGYGIVIADLRRSEEHTSELQSLAYLVCRLLLEKKKR